MMQANQPRLPVTCIDLSPDWCHQYKVKSLLPIYRDVFEDNWALFLQALTNTQGRWSYFQLWLCGHSNFGKLNSKLFKSNANYIVPHNKQVDLNLHEEGHTTYLSSSILNLTKIVDPVNNDIFPKQLVLYKSPLRQYCGNPQDFFWTAVSFCYPLTTSVMFPSVMLSSFLISSSSLRCDRWEFIVTLESSNIAILSLWLRFDVGHLLQLYETSGF